MPQQPQRPCITVKSRKRRVELFLDGVIGKRAEMVGGSEC